MAAVNSIRMIMICIKFTNAVDALITRYQGIDSVDEQQFYTMRVWRIFSGSFDVQEDLIRTTTTTLEKYLAQVRGLKIVIYYVKKEWFSLDMNVAHISLASIQYIYKKQEKKTNMAIPTMNLRSARRIGPKLWRVDVNTSVSFVVLMAYHSSM